MDFSKFTPQQKLSVQHLDGPLFIAAGAGSGKTFTLQQRIAYALLPESGPALSSVDEVLAITFMEKAAAEIKARVRSALRAEGMAQEALKVDSAWISTIHGMCSRILREHALEAGIDPAFTVLSSADERMLRRSSIEQVLNAAREQGEFGALFDEYGVVSSGPNGISVFGMLDDLMAKAASFSAGLDAVDLGASAPEASVLAKELLLAYEEALCYGSAQKASKKKPSATLEKTLFACEEAVCALNDYLASAGGGKSDEDYARLAALLPQLQSLTKTALGRNDETAADIALTVPRTLDWAYRNVNAALARPFAQELLVLARRVDDAYQRALDERAVLDNNGLLHRTLRLLSACEDIAASYQSRFKLVMVDEFQDTNQMQVDLIKLVAGDARLCTVGDSQQSIYRFNGADVSVFEQQRACVTAALASGAPALEARLDSNFRSHSDILAFVRRVCSHRRMFGLGFLDLAADRVPQEGRYYGEGPRIEVQLVTYKGNKADSGVVEVEAQGIARRFASLRDAGHKPGEMVVLLGKMSQADTYAAALCAQGFECVFGGGRSFFQLEEVQVVRNVLAVLANVNDTRALFAVLSSSLLHLSADDFLALSAHMDEQGRHARRSISEGLIAMGEGAEEAPTPALAFAAELFVRAYQRVRGQRPSLVLMGILTDSGWFARLEAQGTEGVAVAANILKAVRMVEELERKPGYGLARVARDFADMAENDASGPASLSVSGQNAVRIMTIHKSKGLEYPIVAVAAYEPWKESSDCFAMTTSEGRVRVSLSLKNGKVKPEKALAADYEGDGVQNPAIAKDAAQFSYAVRALDWEEEVNEAQRKFYVACTRASEYLLVSGAVPFKAEAEGALEAYHATPIFDAVREALMGEGVDFPEESSLVPYGGSAPLCFERAFASAESEGDGCSVRCDFAQGDPAASDGVGEEQGGEGAECDPEPEPAEFLAPEFAPAPSVAYRAVPGRTGVFSYSSIAPHEDHLPVLERDDLSSASSAARVAALAENELAGGVGAASFELSPAFVSACAAAPFDPSGPSATDVGSAFHRAAQLAVELMPSAGALVAPPAAAVDAIARRYGLEGAVRERLDAALAHWFASDVARTVEAHARVRAEVPFMVEVSLREDDCATGAVRVDDRATALADACSVAVSEGVAAASADTRFLEGEIDLLAESADGSYALVIDYKTGGSPNESPERLQQKHGLQATCYAYALLTACGYARVDFAFVRVEQSDREHPDQPQVVRYSFKAEDIPSLHRAIVRAYANARPSDI